MSDNINDNKSKIDFFSVWKRRKRTIEHFIREYNITSYKALLDVIKVLEKDFHLSSEFVALVGQSIPKEIIIENELVQEINDVNDIENTKTFEPRSKKRTKKQD